MFITRLLSETIIKLQWIMVCWLYWSESGSIYGHNVHSCCLVCCQKIVITIHCRASDALPTLFFFCFKLSLCLIAGCRHADLWVCENYNTGSNLCDPQVYRKWVVKVTFMLHIHLQWVCNKTTNPATAKEKFGCCMHNVVYHFFRGKSRMCLNAHPLLQPVITDIA